MATTILVVVDLPAEPVMTTRPCGKERSVLASNLGAILLSNNPGSAEPPPGLTRLIANRAIRPITIAGS
jgi:hypothetical protein